LKKKSLALSLTGIALAGVALAGCSTSADTASYNLSQDAENFKIEREIVFYNGITGDYIQSIQGFCSVEADGGKLEVTCKEGEDKYTKDFLGLSDNVTWFALQTEATDVSLYHRKVFIRPESVLPEFELQVGQQ
jgi:hypothetical protein